MYHQEGWCFSMNTKKLLALALGGALLSGSLTGCGTAAVSQGGTAQLGTTSPAADASAQVAAVLAEGDDPSTEVSCEELFKPYERFGLTFDASGNELKYNGKTVRWFEDYYTVGNGLQAGNDFFNENGVVDVYAVRDLTNIARAQDGSFDPGGTLIGIKEFSAEEFAARDIEAMKSLPPVAVTAGDALTEDELGETAKEYEAFGVTYDARSDQWYFNGEKVRFFRDVLTSNGEGLTSGKFKGSIRALGSGDGTIDIYTVRDFDRPDAFGNGTLTGVEKYSQGEFDEHTREEIRSSSGKCIVTQE